MILLSLESVKCSSFKLYVKKKVINERYHYILNSAIAPASLKTHFTEFAIYLHET